MSSPFAGARGLDWWSGSRRRDTLRGFSSFFVFFFPMDAAMGVLGSVGAGFEDWQRQCWSWTGDAEAPPPPPARGGLSEEASNLLNMTPAERMGAFLLSFAAGALLIVLSILFLPLIVIKPAKFAMSFALGNLLSLFR
mmetsp:Transcript_16303/g.33113  ORF Transcript_16303/g.33113 Transcript_16303/m.33113 type:complete len:138 (-) Transcript_16303:359-772(-)